jgi:hypothetical protein
MRKLAMFGLAAAILAGGSVLAAEGKSVTGTVSRADAESGQIVINDQTFIMPKQGGTAMMPEPGDSVTLYYEEQGGQMVVTRIGQPQN